MPLRPKWITLPLLLIALTACGDDQQNPDATQPFAPTLPTTAPDAPTQAARVPFEGQNTITLADGSSATYQFSCLLAAGAWTVSPGEATHLINSRDPMTFPMQTGDVQVSISFRPFLPPDLTTLEQVVPGAPTTPITLAGYEGLRADFSDEAATHTEGSTILLRLDDDAFLFITVQVAYGERELLQPLAYEILNSLTITRNP